MPWSEKATERRRTPEHASDSASRLVKNGDLSRENPASSVKKTLKTARDTVTVKGGLLHAIELDCDSDNGPETRVTGNVESKKMAVD